jgi:hypothetical protein
MNTKVLTLLTVLFAFYAAVLVASAGAETVDFSGYLYDEGTETRFDVYAETQLLDVTFTYPATADFHVKVLGQAGKELGDFTLAEGPVIQLKGGGKFTFVVYTEQGGGVWTAFYER